MADYEVVSFRGESVSSTDRYGFLSGADVPIRRQGSPELQRTAGLHPIVARVLNTARPLSIHILVEADDVLAEMESLQGLFRIGDRGPLVVEIDGGQRVLDVVVTAATTYSLAPNVFSAQVLAGNPLWHSVDPIEVDDVLTTSGDVSISNSGNATDRWPVVQLQSAKRKSPDDSWQYFADVLAVNRVVRDIPEVALDVTNGGWDHAAEVTAGRSLASGDDVCVLIDGHEVPRWAGSPSGGPWDQTDTKLWVNTAFGASRHVHIQGAMTASSPENGTSLELTADSEISLLPPSGTLLIDDEAIDYSGIVERNDAGVPELRRIVRAVRGTVAASHAAGAACYLVEHRIQVMWGWTSAPAPASRDDLQPMIDLDASTNLGLVWQDFFDSDRPLRSMQWQRLSQPNNPMANGILALASSPTTSLSFEYSASGPRVDEPEFSTWTRDFPSGLLNGSAGNAASVTRAIDQTLAMRVTGRDSDGNEIVFENGDESGPQASGTLDLPEPDGPLFSINLEARSQVVVASPPGRQNVATTVQSTGNAAGSGAQQFFAPTNGTINGIDLYLQSSGPGNNISVTLYGDDGNNAPDVTNQATLSVTLGSIPTGSAWHTALLTTPLSVRAGDRFWILVADTMASGLVQWWRVGHPPIEGMQAYVYGTGAVTGLYQFRLLSRTMEALGPFAAPEDGATLSWDDLTVNLEPDSAVQMIGLGDGVPTRDAYYLDTSLRNFATGDEFRARHLGEPGDLIQVDVARRSVFDICSAPNALTVTGDVIDDHVRAIDTQGDGLPVGNGIGIWPGTTNLCMNGGFEQTTGNWAAFNTGTITRVLTEAKFGVAACEVGAAAATDGITTSSAYLPATQNGTYSASAWVRAKTAGDVGKEVTLVVGTQGGSFEIFTAAVTLTSAWQRISMTFTFVEAAHSGATLLIRDNVGQGGFDFYVDGIQYEGLPIATPYVETAESATSSRPDARIQMPVPELFTETQGWFAIRLTPGWDSTVNLYGSGAVAVFEWRDDNDNRLLVRFTQNSNSWTVRRWSGGSGDDLVVAASFVAGASVTLVVTWTGSALGLQVDGGGLSTQANASIPVLSAVLADLASRTEGSSVAPIAGEVHGFLTGSGTLTETDADLLYTLLQRSYLDLAQVQYLLPDAQPSSYWDGVCARFETTGTPRGQLLPLAIEAAKGSRWLQLPPGGSLIRVEEEGMKGLRVALSAHDRWE